jgi:hypothetical protein
MEVAGVPHADSSDPCRDSDYNRLPTIGLDLNECFDAHSKENVRVEKFEHVRWMTYDGRHANCVDI